MTYLATDFLPVMDAVPLVRRQYPLVTAADIRDLIYKGLVPYSDEPQRKVDGSLRGGRGKYAVDLVAVLAYFAAHYEELAEQRLAILAKRTKRVPAEGTPKALKDADRRKSALLADGHNARATKLRRQKREERNEAIRERVRQHPYLAGRRG